MKYCPQCYPGSFKLINHTGAHRVLRDGVLSKRPSGLKNLERRNVIDAVRALLLFSSQVRLLSQNQSDVRKASGCPQ